MDVQDLMNTIIDQAVTITRANSENERLTRENATLRARVPAADTAAAEPPAEGSEGAAPGGTE